LAQQTGVSTDTLRHYERMKLLAKPPRTAAGYRQYSPESVDRVRMIRRAIAMGFRIEELARILRVRDNGGAPCRQVHALAVGKLADLDRQIEELTTLRSELHAILARWEHKLSATPDGQRAGLLESLLKNYSS